MLKFSEANTKTKRLYKVRSLRKYLKNGRKVYSFDLLAGWSCPGALDCLARAHVNGKERKLIDGKHTKFRCFSASQDVFYPNVYDLRKHNLDTLKQCNTVFKMANLFLRSIPKNAGIIRLHVSGDIFNATHLQSLIRVASCRPDILFYTYTKSLHIVQSVLYKLNMQIQNGCEILPNFRMTASRGGRYDHLIDVLGLRCATVIFSKSQANGLQIDHNDSHAAGKGKNFALLLHGIQPPKSEASRALVQLKRKV